MRRDNPGKRRHLVDVMRPTEAGAGEQGQLTTAPTQLQRQVPCSIEPLRGGEAQGLQQMYATATHKVGMYGNPNKLIKRTDYCIDETGKQLNVMDIIDPSRAQLGYIELICGEEPA